MAEDALRNGTDKHMMLPQTNLQLYRVLLARGADEAELARTRAAYDLARSLFATAFRPSHKPFVCHLVGVAGALAIWNQSSHLVAAGLLHSAYLYGDFHDGKKGAAANRRRIVRDAVGDEAESLVARYTAATWSAPLDQLAAEAARPDFDRECLLLKLADVCDECADGGLHFAPAKNVGFGVALDRATRSQVARQVGALAGRTAEAHFLAVTDSLDTPQPPVALVTADQSFHVVGRVGRRGGKSIRLRLRRFTQAFGRKRAA